MFNLKDLMMAVIGGDGVGGSEKPIVNKQRARPMMERPELPKAMKKMAYAKKRPMTQPQYEDDAFVGSPRNLNQFSPINADVKNFQGVNPDFALRMQGGLRGLQRGRMPMNMDEIPGNFTGGRTGYYQGSNPYINDIENNDRLRVR